MLGEPDRGSSSASPRPRPRRAAPVHLAERERHVVEHGEVREEVVVLEDDPDPRAHRVGVHPRVGDVLARQEDLAVVDALEQVDACAAASTCPSRTAPMSATTSCGVESRSMPSQHHAVAERLPHAVDPQHRPAHVSGPDLLAAARARASTSRSAGSSEGRAARRAAPRRRTA